MENFRNSVVAFFKSSDLYMVEGFLYPRGQTLGMNYDDFLVAVRI